MLKDHGRHDREELPSGGEPGIPENSYTPRSADKDRRPPRSKRWIIAVMVLAGIAAAGMVARIRTTEGTGKAQEGSKADRVIPVIAAPVVERDVPIYLDGLGNVAAFRTVTAPSASEVK